jgi:hypothetical protein
LLDQDIKDIKQVFPKCKLEESLFAQVHPFLEESPDLQIPRRQPWYRGGVWLIVVCWWVLVVVVVVDCCMCEFGATWREVETDSP